ncbi:G-protein coupled receptor 84-like [Asterias rubens]|uniref:G-protein coupled receptor 84-like n=1 Tax=Asterias rubens TaxID=7604 RepID=UPI00145507B6|nr:G-protein coupled receptor 84-like [Asterias rubens]
MASTLITVLVAVCVPFFIVGIVGNIGVILCIFVTPSLRTRTNAIIISLATSCLAFLLMVVPFTVDSFLHSSWRVALWYCHTTAYLAFGFIGITVCNIAALSVYRYFCVVHPTKLFLRSIPNVVFLIVLSWLIPILTQTSLATFQIAHTEFNPLYARCVVIKKGSPIVYNGLVFGGFLSTLAITLFSYAGIYRHVRKSTNRLRKQAQIGAQRSSHPDVQTGQMINTDAETDGTSSTPNAVRTPDHSRARDKRPTSSGATNRHTKEQNYLTKICVVVFALFMVCYGPIVILSAVYAKDDFPADAYTVCTMIYWLGSCLHPLVYATLQPQMQKSVLRFLRCCRKTHSENRVTSVAADVA